MMRKLLAPVFAVTLVVGCSPAVDDPDASVTSSAVVTPSSSPSATFSPSPSPTAVESFPAAPATESAEQAEIRAAWMEYWRVYEKFAADPSLPDWTETQLVATGQEATFIVQSIGNLKDRGWRSLGGRQFRDVEVAFPTDEGKPRQATITYCLDRSGIVLMDASTGEPVELDVPPTYRETATMELGQDGRWRVALLRNEPSTC